jgi:A/G-specific adenine glycosylase
MRVPRDFALRVVAWQRLHGRRDLPWQTFAPQGRPKARTAPPQGAAQRRSRKRGGSTTTRDPYRIWLSEIMLQQTQVATVIPYFERFVAKFPDVRALASAALDDVLVSWSGLGYYRRAHHLHATAQRIVVDHGGEFPRDAATLATLPGIGRSTAAAIAAFSQGERTAILDGNVKRVLARHRAVDGFPGAPKVTAKLWALADALLPQRPDIATYTQGLMDLGASICTRANPRCEICPVKRDCVARRDNRIAELPAPRPRKSLPHRAVRVLVFERAGEILLEKRPPVGIWGGLWSLPEIALDDDARAFARKRFDADATVRTDLAPIEHGFTHFALTLHPQRVTVTRWPLRAEAPHYVWLARGDALQAALPAPIRKLLRSL